MSSEEQKIWRDRGYLPHYDPGTITQFVTYRLADSLPIHVLEQYSEELERDLITEIEYHRRVDKYLDNGFGNSFLKQPEIAKIVEENLLHFNQIRYDLHAWVVMPNHVHLLFTPQPNHTLSEIMHSMKSFTSHQANKALDRTGQFWSKEYFDRYIRGAEHFRNAVRYIEYNPVKAGLCRDATEWPFGSARFRE
jgi:REP element-mobilizing transposase RayT